MEFKIGAGLACVGIAVGIGQWLVPPATIDYQLRFVLVLVALAFFLTGAGFLIHAALRHCHVKDKTVHPLTEKQAIAAEHARTSLSFDAAQKTILKRMKDQSLKTKRSKLLELREEGVTLHNQRINEHQYAGWHQQFEGWHLRMLEAANDLDPELKATLSPLRNLPTWNKGWPINSEHRLAQNMIWEMLERLEKYLDQTRL